jgi:beta-galactosidase
MQIYGADYYPEHWDESSWEKHVKIMKEIGIEWVRVGEFAWSIVEPKEGRYNFSKLEKALKLLKDAGIKNIVGTPTAAPPMWLIKKHPHVLPVDKFGRQKGAGSRRHYCPANDVYREYSKKIVEKYAQHLSTYADMWQIDNEFGCHDTTLCYCESTRKAFVEWLKKRYVSIDELNYRWGNRFWSQTVNDWDEIVLPINTPAFENPQMMLDFFRFSTDIHIDYMRMQSEIIRKYSDKPITHNLMVDFFDIDYKKLSQYMDLVSWDNYVATKVYDPYRQAANHDLMRSLKKKPFLVMEQQPGRVNWKTINEQYPDGYLKLWIKQAHLHGALGALVFRFDQIQWGAEQYHGALLDYAERKTARCEEFSRAKRETEGVLVPEKEVAIYFSYENVWIHRINHLNRNFNYWESVMEIYKAVRRLGYNVDFVFEDDEIDSYRLLIVPYAMYLPEEFIEKLEGFKGDILITCMTSIKDEHNWLRREFPHGLQRLLGLEIVDFAATERVDLNVSGLSLSGGFWCDKIMVKDAEVLGSFKSGPFAGMPCVTKRGNKYYVATVGDEFFYTFMLGKLLPAKLVGDGVDSAQISEKLILLNVQEHENVVWVSNERIPLGAFESREV